MTGSRPPVPWSRRAAVPALLPVLLTACGSGARAPSVLPAAPEPARAPAPIVSPAGMVLDLGGGHPEGVVADPVTGLVAVALRSPNRLAVVDPAAQRVLRSIPVPGSARHLELTADGGQVLVPGEDTDLVTSVSLASGRLGTPVRVLRQPHDVAVTSTGELYVADEFGGAVSEISGGQVRRTFPGLVQPGGAAGTGDTGAVVDVRARLLHVYRAGREIAVLPAGAGPTHALALSPGRVLVADTDGGALLLYDVGARPRLLGQVPLTGRPYGVAFDAARSRVYVTATADNTVVCYRWDGRQLTRTASYPTVRDAYSVAVVPATGQVVVAGESGSQLQLFQP